MCNKFETICEAQLLQKFRLSFREISFEFQMSNNWELVKCIKRRLISDKLNNFCEMHQMQKLFFLCEPTFANLFLHIRLNTKSFAKIPYILKSIRKNPLHLSKPQYFNQTERVFFVKHIDISKPFGTFSSHKDSYLKKISFRYSTLRWCEKNIIIFIHWVHGTYVLYMI